MQHQGRINAYWINSQYLKVEEVVKKCLFRLIINSVSDEATTNFLLMKNFNSINIFLKDEKENLQNKSFGGI